MNDEYRAVERGRLAFKTKKPGVVRVGDRAQRARLDGPRFLPEGLGLDGLGAASPNFLKRRCQPPRAGRLSLKKTKGRMGESVSDAHSPAPQTGKKAAVGATA